MTGFRIFLPVVFAVVLPVFACAQGDSLSAGRDGQHDFDFDIGAWKTHTSRLVHPLTGSTTWTEMDGVTVVRKLWGGKANLAELESDGPTGHLELLALRLYNPQARQWSLNFATSNVGVLSVPMVGEFKDGRGEFYDQEPYNGRSILVRFRMWSISEDSAQSEQAFSDDGGKTWETNWVNKYTRMKDTDAMLRTASLDTASLDSARQRDFDFHFGTWKTHISRLKSPLTGSKTWVEYDGTSEVEKVWGGKASLFVLEASGPAGKIEGMGLRMYNPQSKQWSLNWTNSSDGVMTIPMIGEFRDGRGEFFDQEPFRGRAILTRNGFSEIKADSSKFEQAFSDDGGKTWETNWVMTFER
jgi:hypothetical protein